MQDAETIVQEPAGPAPRATCPNCQALISGPFCATCGQQQTNLNRPIWFLIGELLRDLFDLDSRVVRTLRSLLFQPGHLTREYFAGRRTRYTPPIRLYLIVSFLFFFVMPVLSNLVQLREAQSTTIEINEDIDAPVDGDFSGMTFDWLSESANQQLQNTMETQIEKALTLARDDPTQLYGELMDYMSGVMFFMLPLFAVFLKMTYLGSGIYYAEHLLLAVHNHCFLYLALITSALLDLSSIGPLGAAAGFADGLLLLWIPIYLFMSLRTVFDESFGLTTLKFLFLVICYAIIVSIGVSLAVIMGLFTL